KEGHDRTAFEANERRRARSLLEILTEARADIRQGVDPDLLEQERSLLQLLDGKSERLIGLLNRKHTQEEKETLAKELQSLTSRYQEVQALIRAKSPKYAALTQPVPLTLEEIEQQVVDKNTLLLEYSLGDKRSYMWAVTNDSVTSFELPAREVIEKAAKRVYDLMASHKPGLRVMPGQKQRARLTQADEHYYRAASELSQMVLGPVAASLQKERVVIVADGALNYVPFAALPVPIPQEALTTKAEQRKFMIEEHEVVNLPSASVLAVLRREIRERKPAPKLVALLADPVFEKSDLRVHAITGTKMTVNNQVKGGQVEPTAV